MHHNSNFANVSGPKLFEGEKWLIYTGILGFLLAAVCGGYVLLHGAVVLPEGNVRNAFSFNAAIGMFILSIAAFMPLTGLPEKKRARLRWWFIWITLIGYGIETVQHFRGINPRYSEAGSTVDLIVGGIFGLISLLLIVITVRFAAAFFSKKRIAARPLLTLGIRYAFFSTMIAFAAGMIMILLRDRYLGSSGNFIVLHGFGFHALQTLPLLGWFLEKTTSASAELDSNQGKRFSQIPLSKRLIHLGSTAWTLAVLCIGLQTLLGKTVFEFSLLPILAVFALLFWGVTLAASCYIYYKYYKSGVTSYKQQTSRSEF